MPETKQTTPETEYPGQNEHEGNPTRSRPDLEPQPGDDALQEVRAIRRANEERAATHNRTVIVESVAARTTSGNEKEKGVELVTADGCLYLNSHGEAVLDQDGVIDLQRKLAAAFQAVS